MIVAFFFVFTYIDNPVLLTKDFLLKCKLLKKIKVGLAPANWCIITFFFFPFLLRKSDKNGAKLGLWWTVLCFEKGTTLILKHMGPVLKRENLCCAVKAFTHAWMNWNRLSSSHLSLTIWNSSWLLRVGPDVRLTEVTRLKSSFKNFLIFSQNSPSWGPLLL